MKRYFQFLFELLQAHQIGNFLLILPHQINKMGVIFLFITNKILIISIFTFRFQFLIKLIFSMNLIQMARNEIKSEDKET